MIEILQDRVVINIVGPDSGKFLQGMTTNDVIKNTYSYNYLLSNQGKYLFDFFVYQKNPESYFLDLDKNSLDAFLKRLTMYKLRSNLEIINVSSDYKILYSSAAIKSYIEFSFQDNRYSKLGYRSMIKSSNINELEAISENNLYLFDKYKYSIIDGYLDLNYDKSIPVEYGAEEFNAIDYNKGCYVGQEVISRVKYQGVVRKKIFSLHSGKELYLKEKNASVFDLEGNKLGVICSYYKNQAIALLREEKFLALNKKVAMINNEIVNIELPPWRD